MRGDVMNSVRWEEVNDCGTFQEGDKRRVKVYGEVIEDLEFDNEIQAGQRLYKYYRAQKKGSLLYENEYEEEGDNKPNKKPNIYFSGKTSDKNFSHFRGLVEHLLDYYRDPCLEVIEKENKLVVFFNEGIAYCIRGNDVIIKDEIKLDNPMKYYPEGRKDGDPIPAETINRTIAEKLGISYELFKENSRISGDFIPNN